jgi:hypothetical protein
VNLQGQGCTVPLHPAPYMRRHPSHVGEGFGQPTPSPPVQIQGPIVPLPPSAVLYSPAHERLTIATPKHSIDVGSDGIQHSPLSETEALSALLSEPPSASAEGIGPASAASLMSEGSVELGPPHATEKRDRTRETPRIAVFITLNLARLSSFVQRLGRELPQFPPPRTYMVTP